LFGASREMSAVFVSAFVSILTLLIDGESNTKIDVYLSYDLFIVLFDEDVLNDKKTSHEPTRNTF
jgi:hypothetical protein